MAGRATWRAAYDSGMPHDDPGSRAMLAEAIDTSMEPGQLIASMEVLDDLLTRR